MVSETSPESWIRRIEATDLPAWLPLWTGDILAVGGNPDQVATSATWDRLLDPASTVIGWIGGHDGAQGSQPSGFVHCVIHPNTFGARPVCYLEDLYAAPEARGSGLAAALIETVVAAARIEGWGRVYWHTTEDNYRARGLYDRTGRRTNYLRYDIDLPE